MEKDTSNAARRSSKSLKPAGNIHRYMKKQVQTVDVYGRRCKRCPNLETTTPLPVHTMKM